MQTLAAGVSYFDLNFQNRPRVIATAVLHGVTGVAIVDPGPSSTLPTLRRMLEQAGMSMTDVTTVLLTHIHLDHAGATGTLVAANPTLRVYVHESGAPHLVDPGKLVASASRLWGDDMERLWGEVMPVPVSAITTLRGGSDGDHPDRGERIVAGGREIEVASTPGHASHHVSYFSAETGIAFVGDTAGVSLRPQGYVLPPTPPPDIDVEAWCASLTRIAAWRPQTLFLTHFGPAAPCDPHLDECRQHLELVAGLARTSLDREGSDEDRQAWFLAELVRELRRWMGEEEVRAYEAAGRFDLHWRGLARYWRKRGG
jgi:glyoxylase-like metal-dependent hydrolase (beta-lactamase superfamily II)